MGWGLRVGFVLVSSMTSALAACSLLADSDGLSDHYGESTGDAATSGGDGAAGSSDGDGAAGSSDGEAPKPCSEKITKLLACDDFDGTSAGVLSFSPRTDGAGSIEVTSARAFSAPSSLHAVVGDVGGQGQRFAKFSEARDEVAVTMKLFVAAPTSAPVRLLDLESASGKRLSLVLVGLNLAFAVGVPEDGGLDTKIYPSTIDVSAGAWSPVNVDISDLNATPNLYVGLGERGPRVSASSKLAVATAIAIGAATSASAADIYLDDLVITER
ncbi:MAG: hypothetical protein U0270_22680 [Labilithrix sp.]|mgnify:CR=1 FL=1